MALASVLALIPIEGAATPTIGFGTGPRLPVGCTVEVSGDLECEAPTGTELEFSIIVLIGDEGTAGASFSAQWDTGFQNVLGSASAAQGGQTFITVAPGPPSIEVGYTPGFSPPTVTNSGASALFGSFSGTAESWNFIANSPSSATNLLVAGFSFRAGTLTVTVDDDSEATSIDLGFFNPGVGIDVFLAASGAQLTPDFKTVQISVVDADGDGIADAYDNCPMDSNPVVTDYASLRQNPRGSIAAWGVTSGWLNFGQVTSRPEGSDFVEISAGDSFGVALREDGSIESWGRDVARHPAETPTDSGYAKIDAGYGHVTVIRKDGSLHSWPYSGCCADVPEGNDFVSIDSGSGHDVALRSNGSLASWGSTATSWSPPSGNDFVEVAAGHEHALAIRSDGSLVSWGNDIYGSVSGTPAGNDFIAIAAGEHSVALRSNGTIAAWGRNNTSQVSGTPAEGGFIDVDAGRQHSLGLKNDGTIVAWGGGEFGVSPQSGKPSDAGYAVISGGGQFSMALMAEPMQLDFDHDGQGDTCDTDDDNDGVADVADAFPLDASESADFDDDGWGDNTDTDDDDDGVLDSDDAFPLDATETADFDDDGTGDNADTDDDNDGFTDLEEAGAGTDPLNADSFPLGVTEQPLVFASDRSGDWEIYWVDADSTNVVRLTDSPGRDVEPAFSPDGSKVAFHSERDGNMEIYVVDSDGSNLVRLTHNGFADYSPKFSPDGAKIAFDSSRSGKYDIYVMNVDGSSEVDLTQGSVIASRPEWSPDGSRIAFASGSYSTTEIVVMDADGTNMVFLTDNSYVDYAPAWSPDGSQLAYFSEQAGNREIHVMDVDGSNVVNLTNHASDDVEPAWSSDGSRIVFQSDRDGDDAIFVMNADGSGQAKLIDSAFGADTQPHWSVSPINGTVTPEEIDASEAFASNLFGLEEVAIVNPLEIEIPESAEGPLEGRVASFEVEVMPRHGRYLGVWPTVGLAGSGADIEVGDALGAGTPGEWELTFLPGETDEGRLVYRVSPVAGSAPVVPGTLLWVAPDAIIIEALDQLLSQPGEELVLEIDFVEPGGEPLLKWVDAKIATSISGVEATGSHSVSDVAGDAGTPGYLEYISDPISLTPAGVCSGFPDGGLFFLSPSCSEDDEFQFDPINDTVHVRVGGGSLASLLEGPGSSVSIHEGSGCDPSTELAWTDTLEPDGYSQSAFLSFAPPEASQVIFAVCLRRGSETFPMPQEVPIFMWVEFGSIFLLPSEQEVARFTIEPRCFGDLNGDYRVNNLDALAFRECFGCSGPDCNRKCDYDLDGQVNNSDALAFRNTFGDVCEPPSISPYPYISEEMMAFGTSPAGITLLAAMSASLMALVAPVQRRRREESKDAR